MSRFGEFAAFLVRLRVAACGGAFRRVQIIDASIAPELVTFALLFQAERASAFGCNTFGMQEGGNSRLHGAQREAGGGRERQRRQAASVDAAHPLRDAGGLEGT